MLTSRPPAMIGEALGDYKLTAQLGSGSMGVVYLAEQAGAARRVAIKVLIPELSQNAEVLQRFANEARATSSIHHPGIVEVFDCHVGPNRRAYIVMEYLQGETLGDRLRRMGTLPWPEACAIAAQVAGAIAAAHAKGIIHRDLKPENVFLVGDAAAAGEPVVKVVDFGMARLLETESASRLTMRGTLLGTPEYMSPEQAAGSDEVDHRADIYALGCIMFQMFSGRPPYAMKGVQELLVAHRFLRVPALSAQIAALPTWLGELLARMLSKEPADRPSAMQDIARALRTHEALPLAPAPGTESPHAEAAPSPAPPATTPPRAQLARIGIALAILLALAAAVWTAGPLRRRSDVPAPPPPVSPGR
jgi:eukaryotic-like serine/threonine-protein kinase